MNESETSPPNEWNESPAYSVRSPEDLNNFLETWRDGTVEPRRQAGDHGRGGGRLQDRATRLLMLTQGKSSRILRE